MSKKAAKYEMHNHMLYHAKYQDILADLPQADLIISDPPFLTTDIDFDKQFNFTEYVDAIKSKMHLKTWVFSFQPITITHHFLQKLRFKFDYVWIKPAVVPKTHNTIHPFFAHEIIVAYIHPDLKRVTELAYHPEELRTHGKSYQRRHHNDVQDSQFNTQTRTTFFNGYHVSKNSGYREGTTILHHNPKKCMPHKERTEHPTQKPISLISELIRGYTNKGDTVLDLTAGSGTTLMACEQTERNAIIIESDKRYVDMILKRYDLYRHNQKLEVFT